MYCKTDSFEQGNFVVTTDGHITAIINNIIVDTWD